MCFSVCVCEGVYLLLVSHGALSSDHNLAAGLSLQLFGRESTWAQDPPYEVELHKGRKTHTDNKAVPKGETHRFSAHTLQSVSFYTMCAFAF